MKENPWKTPFGISLLLGSALFAALGMAIGNVKNKAAVEIENSSDVVSDSAEGGASQNTFEEPMYQPQGDRSQQNQSQEVNQPETAIENPLNQGETQSVQVYPDTKLENK